MTNDSTVTLASFPVGISVDLFTAVGALVQAALQGHGELVLAPSDAAGTAARLQLRTEVPQWQVAAALRAAAGQIDADEVAVDLADSAEPADAADPMTVEHMRTGDDGLDFGLGGADERCRQMAANLAAHMIPAMEAMGAGNYLAWDFRAPDPPYKRWQLIIVKPGGLTPHEVRGRMQPVLEWIAGYERADGKRPRLRAADAIGRAREVLEAVNAR